MLTQEISQPVGCDLSTTVTSKPVFGVTRRLLIVSTVATTARAFLLPYADHFRSLGWRVDALANGISRCEACKTRFDHVYDIEWSRQPLDYRNLVCALRQVRSLVAHNRYDIVHVHTPIASFVTRLALALPRTRLKSAVVYTAHGFHFHPAGTWIRNQLFTRLEKLAGSWTDYLITINQTDRKSASQLKIVPRERLLYMHGIGVDLDHFRPGVITSQAVQSVHGAFALERDEPSFVMIAEFINRKRHRDAVQALAQMHNKNAHLVLVGDGPNRESVQALASKLGVAGRVHFAGVQRDVRPYILASRATILPSSQEGLPRSIMESLSCGVPVIGSDIRGTRDLLSTGGGLLFQTGDVDALASQLDWILDNPDEAVQMGLQGRQYMKDYDLANIIKQHEHLYSTIQTR